MLIIIRSHNRYGTNCTYTQNTRKSNRHLLLGFLSVDCLCVTCASIICVLEIFHYFIIKLCLPYYGMIPKMLFPHHTPTDCMVRRNIQDGQHLNKILSILVFVIVLLILLILLILLLLLIDIDIIVIID